MTSTSTIPSANVYNRISEPSEKQNLLVELCRSKGDLVAKLPEPNSYVFTLKASEHRGLDLVCPLQASLPKEFSNAGRLFMSFLLGGEKYFFHGRYDVRKNDILINTDEVFFHLQRRDDYRLRIPESFQALFEISAINGQMKKVSIPIADLSAGGCLLNTDPQRIHLKIGDKVSGHIFLPDREPIEMNGQIRHTRENQNKRNDLTGVQFANLSEIQKNRIASLVMDLYREFFLRHI
jgi:hypothetical protein